MKILCVCGRGVSRSPTIAQLLIDRGHEALAVGIDSASPSTLVMLTRWAELVILTDEQQRAFFPDFGGAKTQLWPIEDIYPRPHNRKLRLRVLAEIRDRKL